MAATRLLTFALYCGSGVLADLLGLPTVPYTTVNDGGSFNLRDVQKIVVDANFANAVDNDGWTLIPPTLSEFARTFGDDWADIMGANISISEGVSCGTNEIFLTLQNNTGFVDVAGRMTSEAYAIQVTDSGVTISGASPLGVWWGTRTILQQAVLNDGSIANGNGIDAPGWNTRGVMLDAGRHYFPPDFIVEMCSWMSFFKQNTFHFHISDNLYNNVKIYSLERSQELYSAFRLWSDDPALEGLNKRQNESYTQSDYAYMEQNCASRGVTLVPEIEAPGHALVFTQWKPELALEGQIDLLNITYPGTIPQMKTIWSTFLPWFNSKVVHIGADEYVDTSLSDNALAEEYNTFVNAMNEYIPSESGKSIRVWGTFPPNTSYDNNIPTSVAFQHWAAFEDNALFDYINNGYSVINSDDRNYIVSKWSGSYPQILNKTTIFHGDPLGGAYAPDIFDIVNATNNPSRDNPYVIGQLAAQWNDYGPNASTVLEAYYSWRDYLPALADKQWGGKVTEEQYDSIYPTLHAAAPAQNLDRRIKSKTSTILNYQFTAKPVPNSPVSDQVTDLSGNDYHGNSNCSIVNGALQFKNACSITTPLTSKGQNYTLSFTLKQSTNHTGALFTGPDSQLRSGNGTSGAVMLVTGGEAYALNYSLPVGQWVDASLIGKGNRTYFSVNDEAEMEFTTKMGINGASFVWAEMAIVAPLRRIGGDGWEGEMKSVKLVDYAG
ncbi:uncharacterized protein RCC_11255 [Ramularia collo-cygni]|uniref:beta-N-acetylhexosaminidase n=1 Tax=Ramularia collo-cygni TaxID=112498 RepID=A0A2D3VJ89_9PEZI|nr:uncharacterized protein RCC_11255 [Ramularia collo-cygni]CZT25522.1 uncharacterized protein RCC_11255 [Ramularia collo-cygni]